jgi:MinD-like ATPase involved in chromosome partitioning or flagellar assembly
MTRRFPILPPTANGDRPTEPSGWVPKTAKAPAPYAAPAAVSASQELLRDGAARRGRETAEWGWRARANRGSHGLLHLRPGPQERAQRDDLAAIRQPYPWPQTVMVANPKGGAGKTPTTLLLAAALGRHRGGYVLAWDDNETRGTLAVRAEGWDGRTTVWDLLGDVDRFETVAASVGDMGRYVRPQQALFDVLPSDEDASRMAQIGQHEFARLHAVLARFYRLLVVDTGNNLRAPNWQAAIAAADLLVVPSTYDLDSAYSAAWMLDHLCAAGRADLVATAVTVLTPTSPRVDGDAREELHKHLARTGTVLEVPYDPRLSGGEPIQHSRLSDASNRAWLRVAATVSRGLSARSYEQATP